ncbi:MAG: nicotinate (nicotinamide) nucleotide adenylyltransferase [Thermoanaerobaculia bacterium]
MNIGICGGTFDPFHRGHLDPVLAVREAMGWERVMYVPAWKQPFKLEQGSASGYHRFAMTAMSIRNHASLYITPIELEREAVSYAVDTLEELHQRHPDARFDWIIGDDNLADLPKWKSFERLFELTRFVVLTRVGPPATTSLRKWIDEGSIVFARNATVPVSSTRIRELLRAGLPIEGLVDPLVSRYIHQYGLYKEGPL